MNIFEEKKIKVADAVLALDLDGTLTNSKKQVTENTKAAIDRFIDAGGTVVLASGRPTFGVMPVAKTLELDKKGGYILSYNGGCFLDCKNNEQLFMKELTHEYVGDYHQSFYQSEGKSLDSADYFPDNQMSDDCGR